MSENMIETQPATSGCGCGGKGHGHGHAHGAGHGHGHGGCGCGGKGRHHGVRTENTPAEAPEDISGGRMQLGLRSK
ncbi:hypothetical protein J2S49_000371 [Arcanobacterium wilhelmae]|uniref:Uncharacterized protein n=1 Tax=Arcanobacterium wilhelmae TaxID=1803177 RepID=A0ABT9N9V9_9ACTO|nr:hypothetical protein [Arcanobacterium wilhelmae]MDP9800295.1 hypothetical protein [Arcanobacterium wilhelmae]WFN89732.1 hypothetical protein P8A24_05860 [Arcanobacterium wilhelmae]